MFNFTSGSVMDTLMTSLHGAVAGPFSLTSSGVCPSVSRSVDLSSCPLSVNMSRCLALARFALGSSRTNSRLTSCLRGLSSGVTSRSFTGGWTAAGVEQSAPRVELPAARPGLQPAVLLQHPGGEKQPEKQPEKELEKELEKEPEEEPLHTIISDTEAVFIRELISNGSDALEKLRHKLMTAGGETAQMEIHLQTDSAKGTLTIQDTGVGMNQEELVANLGTIARSGSKAFLDALTNQAEASSTIIGQFGVGFYSAFMVADSVEVYSRSAEPDAPGYKWSSDGSGVFEIAEATGVQQGTKIVLRFKDDCKEFSAEDRVKEVVTKYSNFVSFPIFLNGRRLNTLQALWMMEPKEISDWQHEEFYRYVAQAYDKPRYTLHYRADAPVNIRSIFYVPDAKPSMFDVSREMGSSVALFSRKVLIQTKATDILPKKLRDVLQQRVIRFLLDQSKKEPEKYKKFFEEYGLFMREGIVTTQEQDVKEEIAKLLRYESSALPAGEQTNLMEYSSRMKAGDRNIYYLCAPNRHLAEHSPYYEAMKQKDMEFDELTLLHLRDFDKKKVISVETDIVVDHYKEEKFEDVKPASERLTQDQSEDLISWMKNALGPRVTNIKLTPRLDTHPAMITVLEMGAARHFLRTQQLARTPEERAQILQPTLEINAGHDLIKKLQALKESNSELAGLLLEQIYDNAMITAGLNDDPRPMISRLNDLLTKALEKH
ncbi:hypothetical protein F7725_003435 [Dissostichus mawsoni]|uniref:TNF receptor-associated protein 1 n=1 Tax=Dissostichus mawsoni TaxID=36200 RepID=A0A7J5YCT4_DISMA|nr:hypothetical protein F7725_003435 [Dissostichus mawsoni]